MAKNIVVYSDGTGQDGGVRADQRLSNVYKMYRASRVGPDSCIDPSQQVAFYDPGLGTDADARGWTRVQKSLSKLLASVAGRGIALNIADCYEFILDHWEPEDRIFLIGFSRGAYTVRCVAQLLALCGVPTHQPFDPSTPFRRFARSTRLVALRAVHQVYEHGAGHPRADFEAERDELAKRFRLEFGSDVNGAPNTQVHFVGVFDTVAALGAKGVKRYGLTALLVGLAAIPVLLVAALASAAAHTSFAWTFLVLAILTVLGWWMKAEREAARFIDDFPSKGSPRHRHRISWHADNYDRGLSAHTGFARQASAIDEDRADFPRVPWGRVTVVRRQAENEPPPLVQLWFAGNHSDVGGSYPEVESRLSDVSLSWMVDEATSIPDPLLIDSTKIMMWPNAVGMQHSELEAMRDLKLWWVPSWAPGWLREGWPPAIRKPSGFPVHPTVHERFAAAAVLSGRGSGPYRPPGFAGDDRFRHYYDGTAPDAGPSLAALAGAAFRIEGDPPACLRIGSANPGLAAFIEREGNAGATIVVVTAPLSSDRDLYEDGIVLKHLDRLVTDAGDRSMPITVTRPEGGSIVGVGRLLIGQADHAAIARSCGILAIVRADPSGPLTPLASFGSYS